MDENVKKMARGRRKNYIFDIDRLDRLVDLSTDNWPHTESHLQWTRSWVRVIDRNYQLHWKHIYILYGTGRSGASRWIRLHATSIVTASFFRSRKNSNACVKFTRLVLCDNERRMRRESIFTFTLLCFIYITKNLHFYWRISLLDSASFHHFFSFLFAFAVFLLSENKSLWIDILALTSTIKEIQQFIFNEYD